MAVARMYVICVEPNVRRHTTNRIHKLDSRILFLHIESRSSSINDDRHDSRLKLLPARANFVNAASISD